MQTPVHLKGRHYSTPTPVHLKGRHYSTPTPVHLKVGTTARRV